MSSVDFLYTPIFLIIVMVGAYYFMRWINDPFLKKVFYTAFTLKVIAAILLGLIYQFYYGAGDTLNYFDQGQIVTEALVKNFKVGIELLFSEGEHKPSIFSYTSRLYWYRNPSELFIVKLSGLFGFLTFNTYSTIALIFAIISFSGSWALFKTLLKIYPNSRWILAISIFYIPSVVFWGSGLMKDSIMLGVIGWFFYAFYTVTIEKKRFVTSIFIIAICLYVLYTIRIYILLAFVPPAIFWMFLENSNKINSPILRLSIKPIMIFMGLIVGYYIAINVTEGNDKYDIDNIVERTKINAEYLYAISQQQQGSAYYLGNMDGTIENLFSLVPKAIGVTLFRPFLWEVKNPLMFLTALESFIFILLTSYVLIRRGILTTIKALVKDPFFLFSFIFSMVLAAAVGLNSFNFGTLARYKIPLLPFIYISVLLLAFRQKSATGKFAKDI